MTDEHATHIIEIKIVDDTYLTSKQKIVGDDNGEIAKHPTRDSSGRYIKQADEKNTKHLNENTGNTDICNTSTEVAAPEKIKNDSTEKVPDVAGNEPGNKINAEDKANITEGVVKKDKAKRFYNVRVSYKNMTDEEILEHKRTLQRQYYARNKERCKESQANYNNRIKQIKNNAREKLGEIVVNKT